MWPFPKDRSPSLRLEQASATPLFVTLTSGTHRFGTKISDGTSDAAAILRAMSPCRACLIEWAKRHGSEQHLLVGDALGHESESWIRLPQAPLNYSR